MNEYSHGILRAPINRYTLYMYKKRIPIYGYMNQTENITEECYGLFTFNYLPSMTNGSYRVCMVSPFGDMGFLSTWFGMLFITRTRVRGNKL